MVTFSFLRNEKHYITTIFKRSNLLIAYNMKCFIKPLTPKPPVSDENKFHCSGIYQLTGLDCGKKYTGQTGNNFEIRYQEHLEVTIPTKTLPSISWRMAMFLERWLMWCKWGVLVKQGIHTDTTEKFLYTEKAKNEIN